MPKHAAELGFGPDELNRLGIVFDEIWSSIEPNVAGNVEAMRVKLAQVLLELSASEMHDASALKSTALEIFSGPRSIGA